MMQQSPAILLMEPGMVYGLLVSEIRYLLFSESILGLHVSIKLVAIPKAVVIAAWYKMFNTNNCKKQGGIYLMYHRHTVQHWKVHI